MGAAGRHFEACGRAGGSQEAAPIMISGCPLKKIPLNSGVTERGSGGERERENEDIDRSR